MPAVESRIRLPKSAASIQGEFDMRQECCHIDLLLNLFVKPTRENTLPSGMQHKELSISLICVLLTGGYLQLPILR